MDIWEYKQVRDMIQDINKQIYNWIIYYVQYRGAIIPEQEEIVLNRLRQLKEQKMELENYISIN